MTTHETTLEIWANHQDQTPEFAQEYDRLKEMEKLSALLVEIPIYNGTMIKKVYFAGWELSKYGELYFSFTTRKNTTVYRTKATDVKLMEYV